MIWVIWLNVEVPADLLLIGSLMYLINRLSKDCYFTVSGTKVDRMEWIYFAQDFIYVPMMLRNAFNKSVELFDE